MRLWSLHPHYLDAKGLTALWREGLLAKKVLEGKTRGYKNHPQLERFKALKDPLAGINFYLAEVLRESVRRGYCFDGSKLKPVRRKISMRVTQGQMDYEWAHLRRKLRVRDPRRLKALTGERYAPHPMFRAVPGPVADWEKR